MKRSTVAKSIITAAFTGLAAIPGLYYAMVVRPVQRVELGKVKSVNAQTETLHAAASTGRVLFGLGLFFLLLLVAFIVVGFRLQNNEDLEKR